MWACNICDGTEFEEIDGLFFCLECQTQSQQVVTESDVYNISKVGKRSIRIKEDKPKKPDKKSVTGKKKVGTRPWRSYEALTVLLKKQLEEWKKLGVDDITTSVVLRLWAKCLGKLHTAFTKDIELPFRFRDRYPNLSRSEASILFRQFRLRTNSQKQKIRRYLNNKKELLQEKSGNKEETRNFYESLLLISAINAQAIRLVHPTITIGELYSHLKSDKIPLTTATNYLPEWMKIDSDDRAIFKVGYFSLRTFKQSLSKLASIMNEELLSINRNQLQGLITRYIFILNLPTEMIRLVRIYYTVHEKKVIHSKSTIPEYWILSIIIKVLAFLFRIDGTQEKKLSEIGVLLSSKSHVKCFCYDEWKRWLTKESLKYNKDVIHCGEEFRKWKSNDGDSADSRRMWSNDYTYSLARPLKRLRRSIEKTYDIKQQNITFTKTTVDYLLQEYSTIETRINELSIQDTIKEEILTNLKNILFQLCKETCTITYQEIYVDKVFDLVCQERYTNLQASLSVI
ncbi:DgyrCDS1378 [Dimorphilus gyrociliatus]|uniref:DgyrCDS1378 n=1 Tax=Dimorphilus gyrociliatus TaxID=2664684 RepID=A0A7I8V7C5_9ANNE|nr:DgyrCDS1378 [Dimorphilus gyrociliatus]